MDSTEMEKADSEMFRTASLSDEAIKTLSNPRVRYTIRCLDQESAPTLDRLAELVVGIEAATSDTVVTTADRDHVHADLSTFIIPKLDALGYVSYEPSAQRVESTDISTGVHVLLRLAD